MLLIIHWFLRVSLVVVAIHVCHSPPFWIVDKRKTPSIGRFLQKRIYAVFWFFYCLFPLLWRTDYASENVQLFFFSLSRSSLFIIALILSSIASFVLCSIYLVPINLFYISITSRLTSILHLSAVHISPLCNRILQLYFFINFFFEVMLKCLFVRNVTFINSSAYFQWNDKNHLVIRSFKEILNTPSTNMSRYIHILPRKILWQKSWKSFFRNRV